MTFGHAPLPAGQRQIEEAKQLIAQIERRDLDDASITRPLQTVITIPDAVFCRVTRLSRFWRDADGREQFAYERLAEDLLCGLSQQRGALIHRVWCDGREIHVDIGSTDAACADTIKTLVYGLYPGIYLEDASSPNELMWTQLGIVSGIPARKSGQRQQIDVENQGDILQIERLLRALPRSPWALSIIATPLSREHPLASQIGGATLASAQALTYPRDLYLTWISELSTAARRRMGSTEGIAGDPLERVDRAAQYHADLLERELGRAELARAQGMWDVQVYYGAPSTTTLGQLAALIRSAFAGDDQAVQRLRLHTTTAVGRPSTDAQTPLTSRELATYVALPREEFLGYQVTPYSRFGLTPAPIDLIQPTAEIGTILDESRSVGRAFRVNLADLTRHVLIAGTTGSGKTNTCLHLLAQLAEQRIPFLVIEPINASRDEYRSLLRLPACQHPDYRLQIFTLGDEDTSPFALNPLEIVPGDTIDAHISRLMTCLKAALPMWPPLPAIFMAALQRTYIHAGFLPHVKVVSGQPFPTISDLAAELDYVTQHQVQHSGEVRQNIIGATSLRLEALLTGAAGRTLGARRSLPLKDLLNHPTVLELRHIGDDGDKALIIGLILMRIAAAQELSGQQPPRDRPKHVILVEEAHRLLTAMPTGSSEHQETTRGEAAQAFAQMLAETRKYGQSIIIAEQLPQKLVRDAIGNTGLKIAHLLTAREDRETLAAAMRLDRQQQEALASLRPGHAVTYTQGQEMPVRVYVPPVGKRWFSPGTLPDAIPDDAEVARWMEPVAHRILPYRLPFWGCDLCRAQCRHRSIGEAVTRLAEAVQAVDQLTTHGDPSPEAQASKLLAIVETQTQNIGIRNLTREARYCTAIHLLYKTCGALIDTSHICQRVRNHLDQAL